jgi:hypothetical protein
VGVLVWGPSDPKLCNLLFPPPWRALCCYCRGDGAHDDAPLTCSRIRFQTYLSPFDFFFLPVTPIVLYGKVKCNGRKIVLLTSMASRNVSLSLNKEYREAKTGHDASFQMRGPLGMDLPSEWATGRVETAGSKSIGKWNTSMDFRLSSLFERHNMLQLIQEYKNVWQ